MRQENLKRVVLTNTIWKLLERFLAQGISFVVSIYIARILIPEDYSVVSIVTIFFTFANLLISSGLNTALIQKKNVDKKDYSTVFTVSVIIAFIMYVVLFVLGKPISVWYDQPLLVPIFRIMTLILPVNAYKSIICAKISSDLQFKKFFFATLGGTLASGIIGIIMAIKGFGAWSLVAQQMTNAIIDTVILAILVPIKLEFKIDRERFKTLFSYGWKILVSSLIGTVYTELNPLFIGLRFTSADLAFYTKGRSFPGLISTVSTNTLSAVLFPVLSKKQDDRHALLEYTRIYIRVASYLAFPLMLGLAVVAENFIYVLLTEKWLSVVPYIRIFCIAFMFDMIHIGNCETIKAMGRSDIYLKIEMIKKIGYFITIGIFLLFAKSPIHIAFSFIVCALIALIVNSVPNRSLLGYKFRDQISDVLPNLVASIIMGGITYLVGFIKINHFVLLIVQIIVGFLVYVLISFLQKNKSLIYIFNTIYDVKKGGDTDD